jgi:hypothetical protein
MLGPDPAHIHHGVLGVEIAFVHCVDEFLEAGKAAVAAAMASLTSSLRGSRPAANASASPRHARLPFSGS